jgi:basic membrane protein A
MQRRTILKGGAALGFATMMGGKLALAQGLEKVKVGFIYVGPIGDGGWTFQHHQGALAVQEQFGDKVEVVWQENVPEGADSERALTQMALSGCNIIFTTSFGYMDQCGRRQVPGCEVRTCHRLQARQRQRVDL